MDARLGQVVLDIFSGGREDSGSDPENDFELLYPAYFAGFSLALFTSEIVLRTKSVQNLLAHLRHPRDEDNEVEEDEGGEEGGTSLDNKSLSQRSTPIVNYNGGPCIFTYKVLRLIGCLALVGLTLVSLAMNERRLESAPRSEFGNYREGQPRLSAYRTFATGNEGRETSLCLTYIYASFLALLAVAVNTRWAKVANKHLVCLLLFTWFIFAHRDFWPLATFHLHPLDLWDELLWVKMIVLTFVAVVIPLVIPRQYVPLDPKNPTDVPNPEQTASFISLLSFSFLDPLVSAAYHVPHLPAEQFPPLADYDCSKVLKKRGFRHIDRFSGARKEHLFFSLLRIFSREYVIITVMILLKVTGMFLSPIGINKLLSYLESGERSGSVRPWFWISWLFLGPMLRAIASEWYMYYTCHVSVQAESIIMQLVLEHALRIRMKAEVSSAKRKPASVSAERNSATEADTPKPNRAANVNLAGRVNNLVTTDLSNVIWGRDFVLIVVQGPLVIGLSIYFLYRILGESAFAGLVVMIVLFPLPGYITNLSQAAQIKRMQKTDSRVRFITETLTSIRMIKLFGWENNTQQKIFKKRSKELKWTQVKRIMDLANSTINFVIPLLTMVTTFATYTLVMKRELTASAVFSSMAVFTILTEQMREVFRRIPHSVQAKVSLERVAEYLEETELLDSFREWKPKNSRRTSGRTIGSRNQDAIGFSNASFVWTDADAAQEDLDRHFRLSVEGELTFKQGELNMIIGPSGSGKSSLLMALLGEMHYVPLGSESWFSLPRQKGVAFAAQESWVQNDTVRENILTGAPYDEERFKKVLYQCGLERDLGLFEAGDLTEVGERGITLSGGQKARLTLARAVYSSAEILLLDDVLAALDVHTSRWIVEKCFKGDLVKGRTILLVTHNIDLVLPYASYVVSLEADGRASGRVPDVEAADVKKDQLEVDKLIEPLSWEVRRDEKSTSSGTPGADGKLVQAEEIAVGHVSWESIFFYVTSIGGPLFWISFLLSTLLVRVAEVMRTWFLGYWATQYETHDPSEVSITKNLAVLCAIITSGVVLYFFSTFIFIHGGMRASRFIHDELISAVLGTTLRWLDSTPTGRIIARCTQDIKQVDGPVNLRLGRAIELSFTLLVDFIAIVAMSPIILFPGALVAVLGSWCGRIYIKAQLSVKREMSNARSPVLNHIGAVMAGLVSIRAYGAQKAFKKESLNRINTFTRCSRIFFDLNRWVALRIQVLGAIFSSALAAYLVYGDDHGPGTASDTGFSLNLAVGFSTMILSWIRALNDYEVSGISLERIKGYIDIEQEPKPNAKGVPPAYWPSSGSLQVEKLKARYSPDGPEVLHDISFAIKPGERIGVVGRTGSGKSSLTLSLLRCIYIEGDVFYDGLRTSDVNLDALRQHITIIPQAPELLRGTLRDNLDPTGEHDDATLNAALRSAGLFSLQSEDNERRITLDTQIASGGSNVSVGQRQVLALARAIVRKSKLLILDEATSAIDYATDAVIQKSLRTELSKDVTCITIAHRLQTIMDADKIMVLDAGRIVEFDSPHNLLEKEGGYFKSLVDESGDRDALYAMTSSKKDSN
ncbi:multidrug resistance-associated ABC transporter [Fomitiporia mediterranea MF3/22]|uniref:multidrug resistance-associated ABC transporter n=1 Tax=Fomitiporia mediterranea (strain MF3/22) TaxID=694068 RepID=UPI00044098E5|nr:multidrug resistance-associated ABC transporter [Fomitiporia mediterranea MF3/22]EJC98975.1 multidrug resistance-associated ABC transporter [Fomitiporia mediterranea MF3/22]